MLLISHPTGFPSEVSQRAMLHFPGRFAHVSQSTLTDYIRIVISREIFFQPTGFYAAPLIYAWIRFGSNLLFILATFLMVGVVRVPRGWAVGSLSVHKNG